MNQTIVLIVYLIEGTLMSRVYLKVHLGDAPEDIEDAYNETQNRRWLRQQIPAHVEGRIAYVELDACAEVVDLPLGRRVEALEHVRKKAEHGCTDTWCQVCDGQGKNGSE